MDVSSVNWRAVMTPAGKPGTYARILGRRPLTGMRPHTSPRIWPKGGAANGVQQARYEWERKQMEEYGSGT